MNPPIVPDDLQKSLMAALRDCDVNLDSPRDNTPPTDDPSGRRCGDCGIELPLREATEGEQATRWTCAECGSVYDAILLAAAPAIVKQNVILAPFAFGRHDRLAAPVEIPAELRVGSRQSARECVEIPVVALPLNDNYVPCGKPFKGLVHDLSTGGAGMIHSANIETRFLALEFASPRSGKIQVVLEVRHSRPKDGCYVTGGSFVCRAGA